MELISDFLGEEGWQSLAPTNRSVWILWNLDCGSRGVFAIITEIVQGYHGVLLSRRRVMAMVMAVAGDTGDDAI